MTDEQRLDFRIRYLAFKASGLPFSVEVLCEIIYQVGFVPRPGVREEGDTAS